MRLDLWAVYASYKGARTPRQRCLLYPVRAPVLCHCHAAQQHVDGCADPLAADHVGDRICDQVPPLPHVCPLTCDGASLEFLYRIHGLYLRFYLLHLLFRGIFKGRAQQSAGRKAAHAPLLPPHGRVLDPCNRDGRYHSAHRGLFPLARKKRFYYTELCPHAPL